MVKRFEIFKTEKQQTYNHSGQLRYVVKYKVRTIAKSLLKHYCHFPMLLMRTTKTAVCLQTKADSLSPLWVLYGGLAKFHE